MIRLSHSSGWSSSIKSASAVGLCCCVLMSPVLSCPVWCGPPLSAAPESSAGLRLRAEDRQAKKASKRETARKRKTRGRWLNWTLLSSTQHVNIFRRFCSQHKASGSPRRHPPDRHSADHGETTRDRRDSHLRMVQ